MKLSEIGIVRRQGTVRLGGRDVSVRPLTLAETTALVKAKPRPRPATEMVFDRHLGRSVQQEKRDAAFEQEERDWAESMQCAEIAAAAGLTPDSGLAFIAAGDVANNARWVDEMTREMKAALTWKEIEAAARALDALAVSNAEAVKN